MKALSSLGVGLSLVFSCLLLALLAELYYILWWKKRIANREVEDDYSSSTRELFHLFCWQKPSALSSTALAVDPSERATDTSVQHPDEQPHPLSSSGTEFLLKPLEEEAVDSELMRLHNLLGPPRFLFTIKEETREDLESEDVKSRGDSKSRKGSRSRSLSDLLVTVETPYMTPLSSPPFFTPPLSPLDRCNQYAFSPLFRMSGEAEASKTPSPKFKFLKDAEEKLCRRRLMEGYARVSPAYPLGQNSSMNLPKEDSSFITIIVAKNKEEHQCSSSSQVLPLPSSPVTGTYHDSGS